MKTINFVARSILIIFTFVAFGFTSSMAADKPVVLKIAHQGFPPWVFINATTRQWAKLIEERTHGEVKLKFFYDTLARGPGILTAAQRGVADGITVLSSFLTGHVRALNAFELYSNAAPDRYPEVAKAIRPIMDKIFAKQNIKYCGIVYTYRSVVFTHKSKHFHKPEDFKGQKIRLPGLWGQKLLKIWGASSATVLPPELYSSAQRGIIDGIGTINMLVDVLKIYEVNPYVTELPGSMPSFVIFGLNMDKWNKLSQKNQDIIIQAAKEAELSSFDYGRKQEEELQQKLIKHSNYYIQTPEEYQRFVASARSFRDDVRQFAGPLGRELMDAIAPFVEN